MQTDQLPAFFSERLDVPDICSLFSITLLCPVLRLAREVTAALPWSPGALPLVTLGLHLPSQMHCQPVFCFVCSRTPLKGRGLHEKGTLAAFRKVLQCKAAYARSCTSVHNVSKEIICLGRCCFTWKHLPAARFHQRADLWIDFPSMTCSICRALKSSFISSAVVRDWSNKMEELTKGTQLPNTAPEARMCQDGVVAEAEPRCRGKGESQKCYEQRQWEWWCPALAAAFPNLCFEGSPPHPLGTKAKIHPVPAQLTWAWAWHQERCSCRHWKLACLFALAVSPPELSTSTGLF